MKLNTEQNKKINEICREFGITRELLFEDTRLRESVEPRQIAMFYLNKTTSYSLSAIGRLFNRHYATVIYSIKKVSELAFTEPLYFERIKVLGLNSYLKE